MSAIEEIKQRLAKYPGAAYNADESHITVAASGPEGFDVAFDITSTGYRVAFEGWHAEFDSEPNALNWLTLGLSTAFRLRIEYRDDFPYRWTIEMRDYRGWRPIATKGRLLFPFWLRRRVTYRQNTLITAITDSRP